MQGCDGSVLLDGSASGPGEQSAPPNLSLRAEAFKIINDLRQRVHDKCGRVVSCADIVAVAARDAVFLVSALSRFLPSRILVLQQDEHADIARADVLRGIITVRHRK